MVPGNLGSSLHWCLALFAGDLRHGSSAWFEVSAVVAGAKDELLKLPLPAAARALVVLAASTHDGEGPGSLKGLKSPAEMLGHSTQA